MQEWSRYSGKEQGRREERWLASEGSLMIKATFELEVSVQLDVSGPVYQTIPHHHDSLLQGLLSSYQK